jgi:hypothetical protein
LVKALTHNAPNPPIPAYFWLMRVKMPLPPGKLGKQKHALTQEARSKAR